jgi:hypothetical protein
MGQPVHQRIAERCQEAGEDQHRPDGHDGHGPAATPDPPPLQRHHQRIQDQGDEPGHHEHQEDITYPVGEFARQVGKGHDGDSHEDRGQRDATRGRGGPETSVPGRPGGRSITGWLGWSDWPGGLGAHLFFSLLLTGSQAYPR